MSSRWPGRTGSRPGAWVVARCHPDDFPEGYHTAGERQGLMKSVPFRSKVTARPRGAIGLRQVDGMAIRPTSWPRLRHRHLTDVYPLLIVIP